MCAACVAGCVAVACPGVVGTGGVASPAVIAACTAACAVPCASAGVTTACFSDDVSITKIVESSVCHRMGAVEVDGACMSQVPVRGVRVGDKVLTKDLNGTSFVTTVMHNKRHVSAAMHMNMTIATSKGSHNLVVTADHVMVTIKGDPPESNLAKAENLVAGEAVWVQGEGRGVLHSIAHQLLDHKNELVTTAGTVLANGIHVTTICADQLVSADAQSVLSTWQSEHAVMGAIAI